MTKSIRSVKGRSQRAQSVASPAAVSAAKEGPRGLLAIYSLTVFLSAFLLFQVQPLIAKYILPWFGGTPSVWTTCMLFFQVVLFGGYAYAHFTSRWLGSRLQAGLHTVLLAAACVALPIVPREALKPSGTEEPITAIIVLLGLSVGLPFFAVSATGPLLQSWYSRTHSERSPYRLYALSNVGSLLALISFPAVFEWIFSTPLLARIWSWTFGAFAVLCTVSAWGMAMRGRSWPADQPEAPRRETRSPAWQLGLLWFALAMVPSVMLLATTNQVCMELASVPFLWVLPLTLYLGSFILCFDSDRWYSRRYWMPVAAVLLACMYAVLNQEIAQALALPVAFQVGLFFLTFFSCAMVCHGELFYLRPDPRHLTAYYLVIAGGGAAGGVFVGVLAPLMFNSYFELQLGLFAGAVVMLAVLYTDSGSRLSRGRSGWRWVCLLAVTGIYGALLLDNAQDAGGYQIPSSGLSDQAGNQSYIVSRERTFYGILRVQKFEAPYGGSTRLAQILINGNTLHGFEYSDRELWTVPTTYFDRGSGVGLLLSHREADKPQRVGIVGLGIGTLASYARPGDHYRFYEINPAVERIAREHFHFLEESRGQVDVIPGDARVTLEREPQPQNFDVLVLDAFTSDTVPVHLLTREAFAVYLRHLAPNGVIAVHISSRHFSLGPVVEAAAEANGLSTIEIQSQRTTSGALSATWELVSRRPEVLKASWLKASEVPRSTARLLWTDDHASLLRAWLEP
jgi:SAM-dependent methyltransferase